MRSTPWLSLLGFLLLPSLSHAEPRASDMEFVDADGAGEPDPCTDVDLTRGTGALSGLPVRSQGNMGVCYAYSAATLIDAYRHARDCSAGDERCRFQSSPMEAAATARQDESFLKLLRLWRSGDPYSGGFVCEVANSMIENGSCDREETMEPNELAPRSPKLVLQGLSEYFRANRYASGGNRNYKHETALQIARKFILPQSLDSLLRDGTLRWDDERGFGEHHFWQAPLGKLPSSLTLQRLLQGSEGRFISGAIRGKCEPTRLSRHERLRCRTSVPINPYTRMNAVRSRIDEALRGGQPAEIGFCSRILEEASYRGLGSNPAGILTEGEERCGRHSAAVAGRRWNPKKNRCEYLIHNSWGSSCASYDAAWDCSKGRIWVEADALSANVSGVSRIHEN